MKGIMANVPGQLVEQRRRSGTDRWDEMWDGVLHMPPTPNRRQQELEWALETWLRRYWVPQSGGRCYHQISVAPAGGWPHDYRIPDLVLLTPERFSIDREEYFEGGPTVVVEIHGPEDEAHDKLEFYRGLGVREVWIVDRDSLEFSLFELVNGVYRRIDPDANCQAVSGATAVGFTHVAYGRLALHLEGDADSVERLF
jgi:Uma2 family endonuclease